MRLKLLRLYAFIGCLFVLSNTLFAQSNFTGINNRVINLPCSQSCANLNFQIPDLKSDDDYQVTTIPYTPYPYTTLGGNELTALYADDLYSQAINLPFPICFYGAVYNQVVVGSNGLLTFDIANANCAGAYTVLPIIPYSLGTICDQNSTYYPRAALMGAFSDLDPRSVASPRERKIEWRLEGTAPFRRFVASWNKVGVYNNDHSCSMTTPTTFQIVINESTAAIDVFFEQKICNDASEGNAILGIQDWNRTKGVAAFGKNATRWNANNEGYRFIPSGGASRFVNSKLFLIDGVTLLRTATSANTTPGLLDIDFGNICTPSITQQYIVETTYSSCIDPLTPIVIKDTITVNRTVMEAIVAASPTTCNGAANGTITIDPTGTAPFRFSLDGAAPITGVAPYTFLNVSAGLHTIIAYDATGCQTVATNIDVPVGPSLTTTVTKNNAACFGTATGSITVAQPSSGTAPFQYSLNGTTWQTNNVFNNLPASTYTVYYREANGCQGSQSVTITEPTILAATTATIPVICNGQNNGIITVTPAGGTAPYQYSIDGGANWQTNNVFNVRANTYTVLVRDANLCTIPQTIVVTEPVALSATAITTNASCNGGNDGTITITATGGNAGYTYSIDNGTNWQSSNVFNVGAGSVDIIVKDNLGCSFQFTKIVGLTNNLTLTPQTDPAICESKSVQLQLISNATQYAWTPAIGLSDTTIFNPIANPIITTQYTVTATLGRCSATDNVMVNVNAAPIPDAGQDAFICYGQNYTLKGSGGVQYTWTPSTYLNATLGANPVTTPSKTITYTLSKVIDAIGCESLTTDDVVIDVTPPIKVTTYPYDTIGYAGDQFQLRAIAAVPNANIFKWTPATRLSDGNIFNPIVTVGNIGEDVLYQVTASTTAGCIGDGYVRIRVYKGPDIYVPTAFTPNNDGKNDQFIPLPVGMKSISYFRVLNRWGQLVFYSTKLNDGWDGKINGTEQPTGTYIWMIQGITKDNKTISKKGTVTLIR